MDISFELLAEKHRKAVIDIFNYYITTTTSAFRDESVGYTHFDQFMDKDAVYSGYAITASGDEVIGFCTLEPFKNIKPFKRTAEAMYFIKKEYVGKGIGCKALEKLELDAKLRGIDKVIVDITDDNEQSIVFHERNGFTEYGRLKKCWKKFGKELGIVYMEKEI